jgi:2-dehydropantoate 2-reductase
MRIAVLGPGGVGGLIAAALARSGEQVTVIARESTARVICERGLRVNSVLLGDFLTHPPVGEQLSEPTQALIVASKAPTLAQALERIDIRPELVLPLLNGLDHLTALRERFGDAVLAGSIRVESDRPQPGVIIHSSPFLRVDMASRAEAMHAGMLELARRLSGAGIPARVCDSEAEVMWGKLVRLNALAATTSAFDKLLGEIRSTPELYDQLVGAIREGCAVASAEGAAIDPAAPIAELAAAHDTLGSSMQRDIAAGRPPELDALAGAVLRAGARHHIGCPTIAALAVMIARRAGIEPPQAALLAVHQS